MRKATAARCDCFKSIRAFGEDHAERFPTTSFAGVLFSQMGQLVTRLEALGATQVSSEGGSIQNTTSKDAVRKNLEDLLDSISRAADAMSIRNPGVKDKFRRPRRRRDPALVNTARAFLVDATPLKADFITFGMGADFLDELQTLITQFEEAISDRHSRLQMRSLSTAGINEALKEGMALRRQLNAVVKNSLRRDPGMLAAWRTAQHIEVASGARVSRTKTPETSKPAEATVKPEDAQ